MKTKEKLIQARKDALDKMIAISTGENFIQANYDAAKKEVDSLTAQLETLEVQAKLRGQVDNVLPSDNKLSIYSLLPLLKFTSENKTIVKSFSTPVLFHSLPFTAMRLSATPSSVSTLAECAVTIISFGYFLIRNKSIPISSL